MKSITISVLTEGEDSNPRDACGAYTLSRRAPSASSDNLPLFYFNQDIKTEAIFHFCLYDSYGTRTRVTAVKGRCLNQRSHGSGRFEPTTDRLTADSSTTELLWINKNGAGDGNRTHNISLKAEVLPLNYTRTV